MNNHDLVVDWCYVLLQIVGNVGVTDSCSVSRHDIAKNVHTKAVRLIDVYGEIASLTGQGSAIQYWL